VSWRSLTEISRKNIFGEKVAVESPAGAKVTEVVGEVVASAPIRDEPSIARHPTTKTVREKDQVGDLSLSNRKYGRTEERASPNVRLHRRMQ